MATNKISKTEPVLVIPDTPEALAAIRQIFSEAAQSQRNFLDGFEKALPQMPISDELKAGFEEAVAKQRARYDRPRQSYEDLGGK